MDHGALSNTRRYMSIGEFSRVSGLTERALRHYDRLAILRPAMVDPETGYRWYASSQLGVGIMVQRLRGARMPLATIKTVLDATNVDSAVALVERHWAELGEQLDQGREALAEVRRHIAAEERGVSGMRGWVMAGSRPSEYEQGPSDELAEGHPVAYVRCTAAKPSGFGTLMQNVLPDRHRGCRLRLSGLVRTIAVDGWVGLWLRVDGPLAGQPLAFDNMQDRAVTGTTMWGRYEVVLDIPSEAVLIAFGTILCGSGEVRLADFRLETVPASVAITHAPPAKPYATESPQNLNFSPD